jgi:hypothetical protein
MEDANDASSLVGINLKLLRNAQCVGTEILSTYNYLIDIDVG